MDISTVEYPIKRYNEGKFSDDTDEILREFVLSVYLGGSILVKLTCTPDNLEELVLGYLYSEGLIASLEDVGSIAFDGAAAHVRLAEEIKTEKIKTEKIKTEEIKTEEIKTKEREGRTGINTAHGEVANTTAMRTGAAKTDTAKSSAADASFIASGATDAPTATFNATDMITTDSGDYI